MTNQPTTQVNTEALINLFIELQANGVRPVLNAEAKEYNQFKKAKKALLKQHKQELATLKFKAYNYISFVLENEGQTMRNKTDLIIDSFFEIIRETKEAKKNIIKQGAKRNF